ncbi:MAG: MFS transporter, partial [Armatimonadetes bacterium]|nr:MFS transporter [Armatimonadota bacterium]
MFTDRNRVLVFTARGLRTFGFGLLSIVLPLYLKELGLPATLIGLVFSLTLVEDALATTAITVFADRFGRRLVLTLAPLLVVLAGVGFATAQVPWPIILVAVIGTISPGGVEAGPFLAVEQAVLSERASGHKRTGLLAWYNVVGSLFAALGAGAAGLIPHLLRHQGVTQLESMRLVFWLYAAIGIALMFVAAGMNREVEAAKPAEVREKVVMGLHRSKGIVAKLCLLFGVDALAGGFIVQQLLVYWFSVRFNVGAGV